MMCPAMATTLAALHQKPTLRRLCVLWLLTISLPIVGTTARADEPLHSLVDRMIAEKQVVPSAEFASDADFLRRVHLDLVGTVPSADEARAYFSDQSPDKRTALVDRLLDSSEYARHMTETFDVMLMERRSDKHVKTDAWRKYLRQSFEANKPYDQLVREILSADGADEATRPAARFYLDREGAPNLLTREVGRIFFGRDLQCAQCHDHPLIDDYLQSEYHGLYAFLGRSYLFTDKKQKKSFLAEKADGEAKFQSVFDETQKDRMNPALPGDAEMDEPKLPYGDEYKVRPADGVRPVPKYSRRGRLAEVATNGSNRAFNRNIVNRLWAHMMGRGIVDPVDLHHPDNPPTHPELLEALANHFVAAKFDIKGFLRELALSDTYRRSIEMPAGLVKQAAAAEGQLAALQTEYKELSAAADESEQAVETPQSAYAAARDVAYGIGEEHAKAKTAAAAARKPFDVTAKALAAEQAKLTTKQEASKAVSEAASKIAEVAAKLPNEKQLADASATFAARAKKLSDETAALAKKVEELTAKSKTLTATLTESEKKADDVYARLDEAQGDVAKARGPFAAARHRAKLVRVASNAIEKRIAHLKSLIEIGALTKSAGASVEAIAAAKAQREAMKTSLAQVTTEMDRAKAGLPDVEKPHAEAVAKRTNAQNVLSEKQSVLAAVTEAASKTGAVAEKLPDDADLQQAKSLLVTRSQQWGEKVKQSQQAVVAEEEKVKAALVRLNDVRKLVKAAEQKFAESKKQSDDSAALLAKAIGKSEADKQAVDAAHRKLTASWVTRFGGRELSPLSPEQLAWSIIGATGVYTRQRAVATAELDKKSPMPEEAKNDSAKLAQRSKQIDQLTHDAFKGNVKQFVQLFAAGAGQPQDDFFATADQALFFSNAGTVGGWVSPGGGNLTDRLNKLEDAGAVADEVYLNLMTRFPTDEEKADLAVYLASRKDQRPQAVQEIVWALLTSTEFRFNH